MNKEQEKELARIKKYGKERNDATTKRVQEALKEEDEKNGGEKR